MLKHSVPTYQQLVAGLHYDVKPERDGTEIAREHYRTSLKHIRGGLAIYREESSSHIPLLGSKGRNPKLHVCLVERPRKLPPRETWTASVSEFTPIGAKEPVVVIDRLKIWLPVFEGNFGDRLDLAVAAFTKLKELYTGRTLLYPSLAVEKKCSEYEVDYCVSKYAVRKAAIGNTSLRVSQDPLAAKPFFYLLSSP